VNTSAEVALSFVSAINRQDVEELASLMAADHVFIDSGGSAIHGREKMREAWAQYFQMFPDYAVEVRRTFESGASVGLFGAARGTYAPDGKLDASRRWEVPAAWEAEVRGGEIALWRVFADLEPVLRIVRAAEAGGEP
jgi:limonene-1,2-epoxide hydrolase